jgi:hypothetical protein
MSADPDAFAVLFAPDHRRLLWTTFGAPAEGVGAALARTAEGGAAAVLALQRQGAGRLLPLVEALQPTPAGGASDAHLVVFPTP